MDMEKNTKLAKIVYAQQIIKVDKKMDWGKK